jgi:hypothetical protein
VDINREPIGPIFRKKKLKNINEIFKKSKIQKPEIGQVSPMATRYNCRPHPWS